MAVTLVTYHGSDPGWSHTGAPGTQGKINNACGVVGAWFADIALSLYGYFAYLIPIVIVYLSWVFYKHGWAIKLLSRPWIALKIVGALILLFGTTGWLSLTLAHPFTALPTSSGGVMGDIIKLLLTHHLGDMGAGIVLLVLILSGITLMTGFSWLVFAQITSKLFLKLIHHGSILVARASVQFALFVIRQLHLFIDNLRDRYRLRREQKRLAKLNPAIAPALKAVTITANPLPAGGRQSPQLPAPTQMSVFDFDEEESAYEYAMPVRRFEGDGDEADTLAPIDLQDEPITRPKARAAVKKSRQLGSVIPPLSLLDEATSERKNLVSQSLLQEQSALVESKLSDFGVTALVVAVHPGPVITRFELQLAPGIKVSKVSALAKDLARSMSVISVRIVEVIPGKTVIGLEIPNEQREIVRLREIVSSKSYQQAASPLSLALGKDIAGTPITVDLTRMPHLLVAGTTGSGKSVCLNALLLSLLYKAAPTEVRLILIDPKMLELSVYEGIPHLLAPVVTDMKEAANALRWCVAEMDKRYQLMAALGVRNLAGYNDKVNAAIANKQPLVNPLIKLPPSEPVPLLETLPYIVVLIDEFADMMMVVGKKVEELIARIAQKARAAGIHLILATQRPSVDVITGLIKANIPTRIAFQVSSKIDSRTIIDGPGAEQLLGYGDMLYLPPGAGLPVRVHGAYVADHEVHAVVGHLKSLGEPDYLTEILSEDSGPQYIPGIDSPRDLMELDAESDPLYDQAVKVVTESRRASISLVQRRLKIGYNRAARLLEAMESAGVVSSMESNGLREVLAPPPVTEDQY